MTWLCTHADELGVQRDRIAIGGASAGGGLAAGLTLMAYDRGVVPVAFQLLIYPMLVDRAVLREPSDTSKLRLWTPKSNRLGWTAYLDALPANSNIPPYAAPARRTDLAGLPPTWLGIGSLDLFYTEGVDYARRLSDAQVACTLLVINGAYHGFDYLNPHADVTRSSRGSYVTALRDVLFRPAK